MTNIMTIMDVTTDLPKPGGHLQHIVKVRAIYDDCGVGMTFDLTAKEFRAAVEKADKDTAFEVWYKGEFHPVVRVSIDDKAESKFKNKWFSMGIYIQ